MNVHPESNWQSQRNRLNHDWLKNDFLIAFDKFINILDDRIEDDEFMVGFVENGLLTWGLEYPLALELIECFASKMSPMVLFDRPPMSRWPSKKRWLPMLVDRLWRNRHQIDELVDAAREKAKQANKSYLTLMAELESAAGAAKIHRARQIRDHFVQFRSDCRAMASAIGRLPHRILVT